MRWPGSVLVAAALLAIGVTMAHAQGGTATVIVASADVRVEPNATSAVVTKAPAGAVLEVVAVSGDWVQVRLPKDASGFDRLGFVPTSMVKMGGSPPPSAAAPAARATAEPSPSAGGGRPLVAILDFDYATVRQELSVWGGGMETLDVGKGIADLLVDELLNSGEVRIIERKRLDDILKEQNFSTSDRADPSAAKMAAIGKVLGVRYLIVGSVTKFGSEDKTVGGAGAALAGRYLAGGAGVKNSYANVGLTCRVVDSSTAEIMASVRADGQSKRRGLVIGGLVGGAGAGRVNMSSSNFLETIIGEATVAAVQDATKKLIPRMPK
jgi:curli biogenesis system outer membrane secretion channel CsgG